MIYWVEAGDTGAVKVGYAARDVAGRVCSLQTGCPWPLMLLRVETGDRPLEAALHRFYRDKHLRAEWFNLGAADVVVDLACIVSQPRRRSKSSDREMSATPSRRLIKELGGSSAVAEALGANRDAVRAWYRIGVPYRHWPSIKSLAADKGLEGVDDALLAQTRAPAPSATPAERAA